MVAGVKIRTDEEIGIALTCKYMGWDWHTYHNQPYLFIKVVQLLRQLEAEEMERQDRLNK